jgi:NADH:ubiquinone oxidoreductase subunit 6 (subunit J)
VISAPTASVREIGIQLMSTHAAALIIIGILLTVALLGAAEDSTDECGCGTHIPANE